MTGVARTGSLFVALVACGVMVAMPATAQSRIRTAVDTTLVTVGDRITLLVEVEHASDARVAWPDSLTLGPFEVLEAAVLPAQTNGDRTVSAAALSLAAFELGELEIPSFEVPVLRDGQDPELLETDRFGVEVVSVGADESGDIREIRGPLGIPVGPLGLLFLVLLVLVPALLAYVLHRRFRPRDDEEQGVRGPPPRPAHELALEALAALEATPLLARGQVKEFHIEVSEILRTYVERRYRVDALEMTTVEVLSGLEDAGVDGGFRDGLKRFLDQCDLVKFAKVRPDAPSSLALLRLGRELVESSTPAVPIPDVDVDDRDASGSDSDAKGHDRSADGNEDAGDRAAAADPGGPDASAHRRAPGVASDDEDTRLPLQAEA